MNGGRARFGKPADFCLSLRRIHAEKIFCFGSAYLPGPCRPLLPGRSPLPGLGCGEQALRPVLAAFLGRDGRGLCLEAGQVPPGPRLDGQCPAPPWQMVRGGLDSGGTGECLSPGDPSLCRYDPPAGLRENGAGRGGSESVGAALEVRPEGAEILRRRGPASPSEGWGPQKSSDGPGTDAPDRRYEGAQNLCPLPPHPSSRPAEGPNRSGPEPSQTAGRQQGGSRVAGTSQEAVAAVRSRCLGRPCPSCQGRQDGGRAVGSHPHRLRRGAESGVLSGLVPLSDEARRGGAEPVGGAGPEWERLRGSVRSAYRGPCTER